MRKWSNDKGITEAIRTAELQRLQNCEEAAEHKEQVE
jgi:hypothetical protein